MAYGKPEQIDRCDKGSRATKWLKRQLAKRRRLQERRAIEQDRPEAADKRDAFFGRSS